MLPNWATQTITRLRPTAKTSRGSTVHDWTNPSSLVISGCSVQPTTTGLSQDGRVLGISEGLTIYCPPGSDIVAGDRIEYGGNVYTITDQCRKVARLMGVQITIQFKPEGFAECLSGMSGMVESETEKIAGRANGYVTKGSGFHVEMSNEPRFKDSMYGVTRPIGRVVANDDETSAEEAENKILSKAVTG